MIFNALGRLALGQKGAPFFASLIIADVGTFTLTGQDAAELRDYTVAADAGAFTLGGQDVTLAHGRALIADAGEFALTPGDVRLSLGFDPGEYLLTGQAVGLARGLMLPAAAGSYSITGQDAAFDRDRILAAYVGTFTLDGAGTNIVAARTLTASHLPAQQSFYTHFGFAALGEVAIGGSQFDDVNITATTFVLTGGQNILRRGFSLTAEPNTFSLNGQDVVRFYRTYVLMGDVGTIELTGANAQLSLAMLGGLGTFTFSGKNVDFSRLRRRMRGFARSGSGMRSFARSGSGIKARAA